MLQYYQCSIKKKYNTLINLKEVSLYNALHLSVMAKEQALSLNNLSYL